MGKPNRADRIYEIISQNGGRMSVKDIHEKLAEAEGVPKEALLPTIVSPTVSQDNFQRTKKGLAKKFRTYGDGDEEWGYISILTISKEKLESGNVLQKPEERIALLIEAANRQTRERIKKAIKELSWQEFESNFLEEILEALGFNSIQITQRTRDDGVDAYCTYRKGLVESQAIVSAKHWRGTNRVGVDEIRRLRGINTLADTAIIVSSSGFTNRAFIEAAPVHNSRSIALVDLEMIADACVDNCIGIDVVELPDFYSFIGIRRDADNVLENDV